MIRIFLLFVLAATCMPVAAGSKRQPAQPRYDLQEGDIVFQGNVGPQSDAIRDATGSPFTHCGVVFRHEGRWMVIEAVQPVGSSPLDRWIARSLPDTFRAYRLKKPLDPAGAAKARQWAGKQLGRNYDLKFRWDDGALYCSEFVWKLYRAAGVELCEQRPFRDYNLEAPAVKAIIDERYGGRQNLPLDELAVAPGDLADSPLLVEVPRRAVKKQ